MCYICSTFMALIQCVCIKPKQRIRQISHNAPFCNRNVHTRAHFCYKMMHCGIWDWCIVEFVQILLPQLLLVMKGFDKFLHLFWDLIITMMPNSVFILAIDNKPLTEPMLTKFSAAQTQYLQGLQSQPQNLIPSNINHDYTRIKDCVSRILVADLWQAIWVNCPWTIIT